jgi:hypothetical protein
VAQGRGCADGECEAAVSTPIRVPPAPIRVSAPIYDWLAGLKADLERERDRQVTFTEVLEWVREQVTP